MKKKPKVIKANTIVIEDASGQPRIYLDATTEKFANITLLAQNGRSISITADDEVCSISIHHAGGNVAASIGLNITGQSGMEFRDKNGGPSVWIESKGERTHPMIEISEGKRRKRIDLS